MKKLLLSFFILLSVQFAMARKVVVTSGSDNETALTPGMLRYIISTAQSNDTITFNVSKVNLEAKLDISSSVVIDGGKEMVTIDGGSKNQIFNITAYFSSTTILIKNLKLINGKRDSDYGWGGAMYVFVSGGKVSVDNCIFSNNEAVASSDGQGGALRNQGGTFTNCSFFNNKVSGTAGPQGGGAVMAVGGRFINCVFSGNEARYGGGVYATSGALLINCTFTNNSATSSNSAGGIQSEDSKFVNCIAYNNYVNSSINNINAISNSVVTNCAIEASNDLVGTDGNIGLSTSPFKGGNDADSLSLIESSTCIDAGTTSGVTVLAMDILGNHRVAGTNIDLGAYEYGSTPITTGLFTTVATKEPGLYPNPSKGSVYFNKDVFQNRNISIEVYDLTGKLILSQNEISATNAFHIAQTGLFQVKIISDGSAYYQKIVIE